MGRRLHLMDESLEPAQGLRGYPGGRPADGEAFDQSPQAVEIPDILRGESHNHAAAARDVLEEAVLFQLADRLAHGCPAGPQLPGQLRLDQPLAWGEGAAEDHLPQYVVDAFPDRGEVMDRHRGVFRSVVKGAAGPPRLDNRGPLE